MAYQDMHPCVLSAPPDVPMCLMMVVVVVVVRASIHPSIHPCTTKIFCYRHNFPRKNSTRQLCKSETKNVLLLQVCQRQGVPVAVGDVAGSRVGPQTVDAAASAAVDSVEHHDWGAGCRHVLVQRARLRHGAQRPHHDVGQAPQR